MAGLVDGGIRGGLVCGHDDPARRHVLADGHASAVVAGVDVMGGCVCAHLGFFGMHFWGGVSWSSCCLCVGVLFGSFFGISWGVPTYLGRLFGHFFGSLFGGFSKALPVPLRASWLFLCMDMFANCGSAPCISVQIIIGAAAKYACVRDRCACVRVCAQFNDGNNCARKTAPATYQDGNVTFRRARGPRARNRNFGGGGGVHRGCGGCRGRQQQVKQIGRASCRERV